MGTKHVTDELPSLLTGDASREVVLEAAEHLRTCVDCQQELVWTVVAHASLTSASRFAPEIVVEADTAADVPADDRPLPDLSDLFATARAEAAPPPAQATHRRRYLAVAAAAAVLVGGGTTWALVSGDDSDQLPAGTTVALDNTATGPDARAVVTGERMRLDAAGLPSLSAGRQYEVWLADGSKLQSIGFLRRDRIADISVPRSLMSRYDTIAVSVQDEGQTQFSGRIVLRGEYS
ncbi:anti-sigma factor domain-containing protein [Jatrophihabitans fulvus]